MESNSYLSKDKNESNLYLTNLKSDYFLRKLYDNMPKRKKLEIVKYNKKIQNRLNLGIKDYKEYCEIFTSIEIRIISTKGKFGKFINIKENDKLFYHIYFNDNVEEIKNKYEIKEEDKLEKIKITIDYQVKSFEKLFEDCKCIESINFIKFYRNNINNMSHMFSGCSSLKEINLSNFNTQNVINMEWIFYGCSSVREINLSNFNTNNVTDMNRMFNGCSSLTLLNLSNFNTNKVINIECIFYQCYSLKEINLSNFNTNNVISMYYMLYFMIVVLNL